MDFKYLKPASENAGYLNAGIFGFASGGKTFTATELAIGTREYFGLPGPIAMFDTEKGSDYVAERVRKATGTELLVYKSKSLDDLIGMAKECERGGVAVFIVDSLSAVWKEVVDAFMREVNSQRTKAHKRPYEKPEFHHWNPIKSRWQVWTDWFLNARMHTIACGRAGYEYDFEKDDNGKKELVKTGVKMKAEGEFGYEPSLLVQMVREELLDDDGRVQIKRRAHVLKDRFDLIDGKSCWFGKSNGSINHTFEFFRPHVERLRPDAHQPIDTESRTYFGVDTSGDDEWAREKRARVILCEEIQGLLVSKFPGQTAVEKKAKTDILDRCFGTRAWSKLTDNTSSSKLREGLAQLRVELGVGGDTSAAPDLDAEPMPDWASSSASAAEGEGSES